MYLHIKGRKAKNQACKRAKHCAQGMLKHGTKCRTEIRKNCNTNLLISQSNFAVTSPEKNAMTVKMLSKLFAQTELQK